jgi:hypothetical protein
VGDVTECGGVPERRSTCFVDGGCTGDAACSSRATARRPPYEIETSASLYDAIVAHCGRGDGSRGAAAGDDAFEGQGKVAVSLFPPTAITLDAALRDLANGSPKARALAAHALGDVERARTGARAARRWSPRSTNRGRGPRGGRRRSANRRRGRGRACLAARLGDGDAQVRQNAAIALGTLGAADSRRSPPRCSEGRRRPLSRPPLDGGDRSAARVEPLIAAIDDRDPTWPARSRWRWARSATRARSSRSPACSIASTRREVRRRVRARRAARIRAAAACSPAASTTRRAPGTRRPRSSGSARRRAALAPILSRRRPSRTRESAPRARSCGSRAPTGSDTRVAPRARCSLRLRQRKLPLRGSRRRSSRPPATPRGRARRSSACAGSRKGRDLTDEIADTLRQIAERT